MLVGDDDNDGLIEYPIYIYIYSWSGRLNQLNAFLNNIYILR
jgi:hypothetical protein